MKTIEEKAKAYDEALERAKAYHRNELTGSRKEMMEYIFPQLCESEDEKIRKGLIDALKASKTVGELKFILPEPTREACIAYLEKQKEQKPAWSEEDEKMRNLAIEWAETMSGQFSFVDMGSTDFRKIITWLKSLRPSWKPSEEQMEALRYVAYEHGNSSLSPYSIANKTLASLYEQLKKL